MIDRSGGIRRTDRLSARYKMDINVVVMSILEFCKQGNSRLGKERL